MKLTKTAIDRASYEGEPYETEGGTKWPRFVLWDDDVPGLGLRITPTGRKTFVLSYRAGSRKRLMTLGPYGVLTVQQARDRARRHLTEVLDGEDPLRRRQAAVEAETVAELAERYFRYHAEPRKKPRSVREDRRLWRKILEPALGSLKVAELTRADVSRLHAGMHETPYQANRVLALLSVMMKLAEKWGIRPDGTNPCRHVDRYREKSRERFLSAEELRRLAEALGELEESGSERPWTLGAVRLLLFTGCRLSEILTLRWEDVDLEGRALHLPDSKTGAKVVHLPAAACQVLASLPRTEGNPYVIEGRKPGAHLTDLQRPWRRIRKRAGLEDVRLHDLRHTFAGTAASSGLSLPMIAKLLGHQQTATTERYAHLAADPVKAAAEAVGREIDSAMKPKKRGEEGEVVELEEERRRRR